MKWGIIFALLFVLVISGVYAQNETKDYKINIKDTTNEALNSKADLPSGINGALSLIFGLKGENGTNSQIIILVCSFVIIFLIINEASVFFADNTPLRLFFSLVLALLMSASGGINFVSEFVYGITAFGNLIESLSLLRIILTIGIFFGLFYISHRFLDLTKKQTKKEENYEAGLRVGAKKVDLDK